MITLNEEDFKIFKNIEERRTDIIEKKLTLKLIDYGAGSPDSTRSKNEMYIGKDVETSTFQMCQIGLKNNWAQLMYRLVKTYKPNNILELGTCCGFSSIYISKANDCAKIYTLEGSEELASIAEQNRQSLNCNNVIQKIGRFQDILLPTLKEIQQLDFVFIDGHHDKDATVEYYKQIKPYLNKDALVIFDDISWSKGMREAWNIILRDADIIKSEDLEKLGICYF